MAQFQRHFVQDLTKPLIVRQCGDLGFTGDNLSDVISVDLYTDGVAYSGGGTCAGACICPDGSTVALTGSVSGKTASVTLTEDCFAITGQIGIAIRVTSGTTKTTVLKANYNVEQFSTDNPVDPGSRIALDVGDLVNRIDAATADIPASDMASLMAGIAPTFSATTAYPAGAYVYYNGTLYRFTTAHAAGSWKTGSNSDTVQVSLGDELAPIKTELVGSNILALDNPIRSAQDFYITTTGSWTKYSTAKYIILKLTSGDQVKITAGNYQTQIGFLTSYTPPQQTGDTPAFSAQTGFTSLIVVTKNTTYTGTAPSDANYLYLYLSGAGTNRTPALLEINGYNYVNDIIDNIQKIISDISDLNGDIQTVDDKVDFINSVTEITASAYSNLLANVTTPGTYYFSHQGFTDGPEYASIVTAASMRVTMYASTIVIQEVINTRGVRATRLVVTTSNTPYTNNIAVDKNGWFYVTFSRWKNKKIVCFGDSRTWYDGQQYTNTCKPEYIGNVCVGYEEQIRILLGALVENQGVSGDTSTGICSRIRSFNFANYDAVLLEGGVNDKNATEAQIGTLQPIGSTFDTNTIYGAWQSAIEYLMTNYPNTKIFITAPAIAWFNTGTVLRYEIAEIKEKVAELYMLPVLNLYKTAGITELNRDAYYCDNVSSTGWHIHFNDFGNMLIGQMIAKYIDTH